MKLQHLKSAVVVVGQDHNPTILHPSFLVSEKIVPEDWELAAPPVCTPAFSLVQYANGIGFNVESNRLVVTDTDSDRSPIDSPAPGMAAAYIEKLPHVHYKAVGLNLHGFVRCDNPEAFIIERFLKEGAWNDESHPVKAFGARFVYPVEDATLQFSCDAGTLQREGEEQRVLLVNGNYHSELPDGETVDRAKQLITRHRERHQHFTEFAKQILGLES